MAKQELAQMNVARLRAPLDSPTEPFAATLAVIERNLQRGARALTADAQAVLQVELAWARRVLEASEKAGGAAVAVDGRMVDRPVILRAQALLRQAGLVS